MQLVPSVRPLSDFARTILNAKYAWTKPSGHKQEWEEVADRVVDSVCTGSHLPLPLPRQSVEGLRRLVRARKFIPGGRFLYAAGRPYHQTNNCFLLRAHDSREGWAHLASRTINCLMSGGGIGVDYDPIREEGAPVSGLGGHCTGPCSLMQLVNEQGRHIMQGGSRRSAIWARLSWRHPDVMKFLVLKDWPDWLRSRKELDFNTVAPMDMTNISVGLDDEFFEVMSGQREFVPSLFPDRHRPLTRADAERVYWAVVEHMVKTAEPGFSVDTGVNAGETLRNACTELCSADDDDVCCLGSLVLSRFASLEEFEEGVELGTMFLVAGTLYSHLPYAEVAQTRDKNRRLGLGLMGFHEWLLRRGRRYGPDAELGRWLAAYATSTQKARDICRRLSISPTVKSRALAPNGTIAIVAETTSSLEPIFAVAFKRRYLKGKEWAAQYVVDAAAQRLIDDGCDPDLIEDAYTLAEDVERRVAFQAWTQGYVDHGISSTINLPAWGSSVNNDSTVRPFGQMLLKYLPSLRGITAYPDGSRGGQPLTRVSYREAVKHLGREVLEHSNESACPGGACAV